MSLTKTVPFFCVRTVSYRLEANKSCSNFLEPNQTEASGDPLLW